MKYKLNITEYVARDPEEQDEIIPFYINMKQGNVTTMHHFYTYELDNKNRSFVMHAKNGEVSSVIEVEKDDIIELSIKEKLVD